MKPERLVFRHPVLYHLAEEGSWENVRGLGLLSTSALLDRFEVEDDRGFEIESRRRPEIVEIGHPEYGRALLRDNKPMQEAVLRRCLVGIKPRDWYEMLNRRVFFWVDRWRLLRLLGAREFRDRPHLVLEVETERLVRRHAPRISLSRMKSGATLSMKPALRASETFRRIADHPGGDPIVELAVDYAIPDAADPVFRVSRWLGAERLETLRSREG